MPQILHNKPREVGEQMLWRSDVRNPQGDVAILGGKPYIVESCEERGFEKYLLTIKRK